VLGDVSAMDHEDLVVLSNPSCTDLADQEPLLNYLRYFLGALGADNLSVNSCADAVPYCDSITKMPEYSGDGGRGWAARFLCSQSCGCQNPGGDFILTQGCPFEDVCQSTQTYKSLRESMVCVEKNASQLRNFAPWVKWVETFRAYGLSAANLERKADALLLANAMWDHGCAFGQNLTDQNITWGTCFSWSYPFNLQFKTIEAFCPQTCGCGWDHRNSACPQPFGLTCDDLWHCLTWNERHYCPGFTDTIQGEAVVAPSALDHLGEHWEAIQIAYRMALAQLSGEEIPLETVIAGIEPNNEFYTDLTASFTIFMVDPNQNMTQMQSQLFSASTDDLQALFNSNLGVLGVSPEHVASLNFQVFSFGIADGSAKDRGRRRLDDAEMKPKVKDART